MHLPASIARVIADLTVPEMETRIVDKIAAAVMLQNWLDAGGSE